MEKEQRSFKTEIFTKVRIQRANSTVLDNIIGKTAAITKDTSATECEADTEYGKKGQAPAINTKDSSRITRKKDTGYIHGSAAIFTRATIRITLEADMDKCTGRIVVFTKAIGSLTCKMEMESCSMARIV